MSGLPTRARQEFLRAVRDLRAATAREVLLTTIGAILAGGLVGFFAGGSVAARVAAGVYFALAWGAAMLVWVVRKGRRRAEEHC